MSMQSKRRVRNLRDREAGFVTFSRKSRPFASLTYYRPMDDESDSVHSETKETKPSKRGGASKSYSKVKKKRSQLSEAEKSERRQKHNQVEIRRRNRINQRFSELGDIIGCSSKQKRNILATAIDKLKECSDRVKQLQANIDSIATSEQADAAREPTTALADGSELVDHRSVFMHAGIALFVGGFDGRLIECNEKFAELFGFTREAILSNQVTIFSLTARESLAVTFAFIGHLMRGSCRVELKNLMLGPQNQVFKAEITAWLIRENTKPKCFTATVVPDRGPRAPLVAPPAPSSRVPAVSFAAPPSPFVPSWFLPTPASRSVSEPPTFPSGSIGPEIAGRLSLTHGGSAVNGNALTLTNTRDGLPPLPPVLPAPASSTAATSSSAVAPLEKPVPLGPLSTSSAASMSSSLSIGPYSFTTSTAVGPPQSPASSAPFTYYPNPTAASPSAYQQASFASSFLPFPGLLPDTNGRAQAQYPFPTAQAASQTHSYYLPVNDKRSDQPPSYFSFPPPSGAT